ncbi:hypothetical protein Tco_1066264 [Tanacetum coccineum]|uniref:Uncharacterized protein n=1 Tax=Tanacetum coccineum TaxID=301880 RepID=A0ABQ5HBD2_9ASTR
MISPGSSGYSSNDMVYKHYLEEAKKKTQESSRNSEPSVMPSARSPPKAQLWWKSTGKIFKTVGLKWIPTGKIFTSSTTKVNSEPTNGSNDDITNKYECEQTLDVSTGTLNLSTGTSFNPKKEGLRVCSELGIYDHNNEQSSSKLVPKVVPPADKITTLRQELELLFHHHITMLRSTFTYKNEIVDAFIPAMKSDIHYHYALCSNFKDILIRHRDSRIWKAQELKRQRLRISSYIHHLLSKISSLSREIVSKISR